MSDATTQRVTTERARELLAGATPGPWRAGLARTIISIRSAARGICGISVSALHVYIDDRDGFIREQRANAALIAAAPDLAADLIAARAEIDTLTKQRDNAFGYVESIEGALNGAGVQDWIEHWSGHPEEPPSAEQADPLSRVMMLIEERDALRADLAAARDLRGVVTAEEHARAVREAYADSNCFDSTETVRVWWLASDARRDLIAALTRHVGPERAAALSDGVGGWE